MTRPIPLLRISTLLPFVEFLNQIGTPTEKLLRQSKLPIYALDEPNALISRQQAFAFLDKSAYQESIPNLGYLVGKKTPLVNFGAFGRLICQSLTLYDAISRTIQLSHIFNSGEHYWLIEQGEKAYLCQEYTHLEKIDSYHASQFSLMLMIDLIHKVAGKKWYPTELFLQTNQKPKLTDDYLIKAQINSKVKVTAIAFPRAFLALPLTCSFPRQDQKDYENLHNSAPSLTFSQSLGQVMISYLRESYPSIQLAAEIAQMSVRTLQRRLTDEGLSYSQLITRFRYEKAIQLLQDSSLKIIEVSHELGYEDPAHFTRAFKQWTGLSPREFRRQNYQVIGFTEFANSDF